MTDQIPSPVSATVLPPAAGTGPTRIDWDALHASVRRGIREHVLAYAIPANGLGGGDPVREERIADAWADLISQHVMTCVRHDLGAAARSLADTIDQATGRTDNGRARR